MEKGLFMNAKRNIYKYLTVLFQYDILNMLVSSTKVIYQCWSGMGNIEEVD